jgi:hypothetical protein
VNIDSCLLAMLGSCGLKSLPNALLSRFDNLFSGEFKSKGGLRKLRVLRKPSLWLTGFERTEAVRRCSNGVKTAGEVVEDFFFYVASRPSLG